MPSADLTKVETTLCEPFVMVSRSDDDTPSPLPVTSQA